MSLGRRRRTVLTKDLLRVSRAGGGYHPGFAADEPDARRLAARVIGVYQGHVGESREALDAALTDLEREAEDFKLVRGLAKLVDREATFETRAPVDPPRARRAAFEAAEAAGVVEADERATALACAADRLDATPDAVAESLYADREARQVLVAVDPRWKPDGLVEQYDLSLAQTALFDATEVRVRSNDPRRVISAVKRLGLMYEIRRTGDGDGRLGDREVVVTGPDALFRRTRRYGTGFARLLRSVAGTADWRLAAAIDDRGTERELVLTDADVSVPGVEPIADVGFDSDVEAEFAARFEGVDLDWRLVREPEPLAAGAHVVIPDFVFDYAPGGDPDAGPAFRVFFEVMGFWTPEYVEKKLDRLADLEDVEMLVAVDESLGVGEAIEARDHRAIPYSGSIRLKDVRDALRRYEERLVADAAAGLPDELRPAADAVALSDLAAEYGVGEDALDDVTFPEHELVGRTLVRPDVLEAVAAELSAGMNLSAVEDLLGEHGLGETSAVLSRLGYEVAWEGLSGGTLRER